MECWNIGFRVSGFARRNADFGMWNLLSSDLRFPTPNLTARFAQGAKDAKKIFILPYG